MAGKAIGKSNMKCKGKCQNGIISIIIAIICQPPAAQPLSDTAE